MTQTLLIDTSENWTRFQLIYNQQLMQSILSKNLVQTASNDILQIYVNYLAISLLVIQMSITE